MKKKTDTNVSVFFAYQKETNLSSAQSFSVFATAIYAVHFGEHFVQLVEQLGLFVGLQRFNNPLGVHHTHLTLAVVGCVERRWQLGVIEQVVVGIVEDAGGNLRCLRVVAFKQSIDEP